MALQAHGLCASASSLAARHAREAQGEARLVDDGLVCVEAGALREVSVFQESLWTSAG
eukprot:CAMPEP_0176295180 /NCGR_PEP_ID=MMETSP0121_2-20121125/57531_1 /TAXON_ID=160619 /ORGANISM="Kryptoperidinium foliaceum, Strain CCMP 1326" /LENGTH=57 /DNA_ID=CAMNT_0017636245 /DNA_START=137 /DNA_END=307 /DNA_ORIENTATION=+